MNIGEQILIGLALAGVGATIWAAVQLIRHHVARANLRALAARNKGRFNSHGLFGPHEIWFRRGEAAVQVADTRTGNEPHRLEIGFIDARAEPVRFRLRMRSWASRLLLRLRNLSGRPLVEDPEFERRFLVEGDSAQVAGVFRAEVRAATARLHELCGRRDLRIASDETGLYLTVPVSAYFEDDLAGVLDAACRLYDHIHTAMAGAVPPGSLKILESISRVPGAGGDGQPRCPVCGADDGADWVICRQCRTPHHRDCWTYNDGCAVYACRGKRQRRAG
jgi:hypothetical protein